ncbi:hypothetical protein VHUM_04154 [Vanrija humicola]|uniref:Zn(2)-C6 fungal-type domain-containing protein n=1 Tax=Vanrija humicola TaxID=5417 RepID=A0A7D8YZ59_VANHU|nr:hypothetical protein VHUM_04154 [Vanrija humicola]
MDTDSGGSTSNTPSRGPNLESPRVSQRASNSCAFCTKRKIKCNKAIPCDNCIRRGHPESCTRLPAIVRGRLINAPSAAQRAPLTPDQIRLLREGQLQRENVGLRRRVGDLESRIRELEAGGSGGTPSARPGSRAMESGPSASGPTPTSSANGHAASGHTAHREGPEKSRQDDPDVLEPFVHVMGIPKQPERSGSPHPGAGKTSSRGGANEGLPDLPSRKSTDLGQTDLLTLLPTPPQSSLIIRASFKYLCFFHPSVHVPTFIKEHDEWIAATAEGENIEKGDAWLSYYFGLLSVGMYMCGDLLAPELNLTADETLSLSSFWFDVTLEALNRSKFMSTNPTMEALMTICILPIVSYHFGASAYCEMLLHVGLRIAQMLRLHLLTPEPEDLTDLTPGLIYRETGRRIWLHLRLGEGRPDFANVGGLRLPQGATAEPMNVDDEDITDTTARPRPTSHFTRITHLLCAGRRYRIFRQFAEAFAEATSLKDQYVIAMAADQALQANFASFPALNGTDGDMFDEQFDLKGPHDFRPHSRYIWSLLQSSGTVLVYRSFLGRAYVDERFSEVRDVSSCVDHAAAANRTDVPRCGPRNPAPAPTPRSAHVPSRMACGLVHGFGRRRPRNRAPARQSQRRGACAAHRRGAVCHRLAVALRRELAGRPAWRAPAAPIHRGACQAARLDSGEHRCGGGSGRRRPCHCGRRAVAGGAGAVADDAARAPTAGAGRCVDGRGRVVVCAGGARERGEQRVVDYAAVEVLMLYHTCHVFISARLVRGG